MTIKLETYDPKKSCPKCGFKKVKTYYCIEPSYGSICYENDLRKEHLHRCCERCHFEWLEKVLEKVKKLVNLNETTPTD